MKKTRLTLLTAILALVGLSGCNKNVEDQTNDDFAVTSVTLDKTYATVEEGESLQLTPTITYKDEKEHSCYKEWKTSNAKIATVSETGLVLALKPGNVSITFIAGFKSAACSITVPSDDITPIDPDIPGGEDEFSIELNSSSISLVLDDVHNYYQLEATTSAQADITWSSSNEDVATVSDSGLVTAIAEGDAVITATANEVSVTCDVSVLTEPEEDVPPDENMTVHIYFFIDYNNVDEDDLTGKKLLAKFWWYEDRAIGESGQVPANPTNPPIPAFPYFAGWSDHPLIDSKDDLIDLSTYSVVNRSYIYIYGIWTDVQGGM